jgi:hypothetical protein
MIESRNIGRTTNDFQCRVRIINGLFGRPAFSSEVDSGSREGNASDKEFWQQQSAAPHKKGRREAGLFSSWELR